MVNFFLSVKPATFWHDLIEKICPSWKSSFWNLHFRGSREKLGFSLLLRLAWWWIFMPSAHWYGSIKQSVILKNVYFGICTLEKIWENGGFHYSAYFTLWEVGKMAVYTFPYAVLGINFFLNVNSAFFMVW